MNKEIRTGIIAIFTIVVLIYGINYLKGLNILDKNRIFHANYDNIDGLLKGSVISLNGFNVGIVSNISLQSDNLLLVSVKINEDFDMPANSILKISNQDLMGTKGISVILGNSDLLLTKETPILDPWHGGLTTSGNLRCSTSLTVASLLTDTKSGVRNPIWRQMIFALRLSIPRALGKIPEPV